MNDIELRHFTGALTCRAKDDGDNYAFTGRATTYGTWYEPYGKGANLREMIAEGAFDEWLAGDPNIHLLVNHGGLPLATTTADTLTIEAAGEGVDVRARLDKGDPDVLRVARKIARGDVDGMSVGMRVLQHDYREGDDGEPDQRIIERAELHEVTITHMPANPATTAEVRSRLERQMTDEAKATEATAADADAKATELTDDTGAIEVPVTREAFDALVERVSALEGNLDDERQARLLVEHRASSDKLRDAIAKAAEAAEGKN